MFNIPKALGYEKKMSVLKEEEDLVYEERTKTKVLEEITRALQSTKLQEKWYAVDGGSGIQWTKGTDGNGNTYIWFYTISHLSERLLNEINKELKESEWELEQISKWSKFWIWESNYNHILTKRSVKK